MDKKIFLMLYNFTLNHKFVCVIIKVIVYISAYIFFLLFGIMSAILLIYNDERFFRFFFVTVFVILFNMIIRKVINRKRPFDIFGIDSIVYHKSGGSFPSNHSASAMIISFAFFYINHMAGIITFIMAFITGISRVFAGIHYLSDVIAGFFVGSFFGCIFFYCYS